MKNRTFTRKSCHVPLLLAAMFALAFASCSGDHSITARIRGMGNDSVLVWLCPLENYPPQGEEDFSMDTIVASGGRFTYDLPADGAYIVYIEPFSGMVKTEDMRSRYPGESFRAELVLRPGEKATLTGSVDGEFFDYTVREEGINRDKAELRRREKELIMEFDGLQVEMMHYFFWGTKTADNMAGLEEQMMGLQREKGLERRAGRLAYIRENPDRDLSALLLFTDQPIDTFAAWYPKLDERVKTGVLEPVLTRFNGYVEEYNAFLAARDGIRPGNPAPLFTLKNDKGEDVSLADIDAELVVLDFWGSWCVWCIGGFPRMKKTYQRYGGRMEIVGIACQDREDAWLAAIGEHELPWIQLIDDPVDKVSLKYAVEAYPTKVIIGRDGKIVDIFRGENIDFYEAVDALMNK